MVKVKALYSFCTGRHLLWDHTVLPCHPTQVNAGRYSIDIPRTGRLSTIGGWLYTEMVYLSADMQSPIPVVTGPGVDRDQRVTAEPSITREQRKTKVKYSRFSFFHFGSRFIMLH